MFTTQAPAGITHTWSAAFGDVLKDDYGLSVHTDASGNLLVAGAFQGTVDFGGGPLTSQGNLSWRDMFLAKFDAAGNHIWSRSFGAERDDNASAALADPWGNVILTGRFWGIDDFGGGPIGMDRNYTIMLAKFDAAGNHIWSRSFGSEVPSERVYVDGADIDSAGTIFLTGYFRGTFSLGGAPLSSTDGAVFVARYDTSGAYLWSVQIADTIPAPGGAIQTSGGIDVDDAGSVFVTGCDDVSFTLSKYDSEGIELWMQRHAPSGFARYVTPAADGYGNVFLTGMFGGVLELGEVELTSDDWGSAFVAKLDGNGEHLWSRAFSGGSYQDSGRSACADPFGNVIVAGTMNGEINFGGAPLPSAGGFDGFLVKFDVDGHHMWSTRFGGSGNDGPLDAYLGTRGGIYLTGSFQDTVSLGGDPLVSAGRGDIFVSRHDPVAIHFFNAHVATDAIHLYTDVGPDLGIEAVEIHRAGADGPFSLHQRVPHTGGWLHYTDRDFTPGRIYRYRLRVETMYGESSSTTLTLITTRYTTALLPNAPNPFNPSTTIRYELETSGPITLSIYDVRGRHIATLFDDVQSAGPHTIEWNGTNAAGNAVGSGVYFCRLESGGTVQSHRMVLVK